MGGTWQAKAGVGPMKGEGCHIPAIPACAIAAAVIPTTSTMVCRSNTGGA